MLRVIIKQNMQSFKDKFNSTLLALLFCCKQTNKQTNEYLKDPWSKTWFKKKKKEMVGNIHVGQY